jgi:glycosyltransferase involved in cell wall biosynthesis
MPRVSIGLPVFNGAEYLEDSIRSVLDQTLGDFELIVSDNASTDRTGEIVQDLAAADSRIRYVRNDRNLGAAPNYNRAFHASSGAFFKWLAHDDRMLPRFLEVTLAALEAEPEAVLVNTVVQYVDASGKPLGVYRSVLGRADSSRPSDRFGVMVLRPHTCVDFFGLLRRSVMTNSLLHGPFHGADKVFLAQMALRGRLIQLDGEPLVQMREHPGRYTRQVRSTRTKLAWHDTSRKGRVDVPAWTLYRAYRALVEAEPLDERERAACRRVLRRFWLAWRNSARLAVELVSIPFPNAAHAAFEIKARLFGAPGDFSS